MFYPLHFRKENYPPLEFSGSVLTRVSAADVHVLVAELREDCPEHLVGGVTLGAHHEVDPSEPGIVLGSLNLTPTYFLWVK